MAKSKSSGSPGGKAQPDSPVAKAWSPRRRNGARAVGSFVPEVTKPAIEKFGFASAALIEQWSRIVGSELAAFCQPERIRWPRRRADIEDQEQDQSDGATLTLRVDPARALDVQYASGQLIERINSNFGYRAIAKIVIIQAPIARPAVASPLQATRTPATGLQQKPGLEGAIAKMEALRLLTAQRRR